MSQAPIELKGSIFTLSVVHLHHTQPDVIRQALQNKIDQAPEFLKNAPVVLNVAMLTGEINWKKLQQAVIATGLRIVGVSGCKDDSLQKMILRAGLPLIAEGKQQKMKVPETSLHNQPPHTIESKITKTRVVNTPVRSGQQIYAPNADLIVVNSVSAGAELVADGNIHIYGMMRGRALAGAGGDHDSQIFSTCLSAELVSIAGEYWVMDQISTEFFAKAVRLYLQEGALKIETLN